MSTRSRNWVGLLIFGSALTASMVWRAILVFGEGQAAQSVEFNRDIRPILSDKCFTCHGPDAANRKTKLRFDNEEGARIDLGKGRHAIVPGDAASSGLYQRITADNPALRMPPAYAGHDRLKDREIDLIRRWIEQGAVWQRHWAWLPPTK